MKTSLEKLRDFYAGDADEETRREVLAALVQPDSPESLFMAKVRAESQRWLGWTTPHLRRCQADSPLSSLLTRIYHLDAQMQRLFSERQFEGSLQVAQEICALVQENLGDEHPEFASALNCLRLIYHAIGQSAASESARKQALEIVEGCRRQVAKLERLYAKSEYALVDPQYLVSCLRQLARLYDEMGEYPTSDFLHSKAENIERRHFGQDDPAFVGRVETLLRLYCTDAYNAVGGIAQSA